MTPITLYPLHVASFTARVREFASRLGLELVEKMLVAAALVADPTVPRKVKLPFLGAFGYLISPADAIPDPLPAGLTDDMAVFLAAFGAALAYVTWRHVRKARRLMHRWHLPTKPIPEHIRDDDPYFF